MGVWGPGNFDSDTVADGLGELTNRIIGQIAQEFEDESDDSALQPDEWGGEMVPAWLEILIEMVEPPRVGATFPSVATLIDWRDRYLRVWDEYIDELEPEDEYKVERRAVLVSTFERAVALAGRRERD
ncbi:DUF4259 domain-containing protein [Mycolicibacterium fortuitum]|uniref:DUF4259 domain-containing protein n=1 Tax=Mycolicibacterium fortuitum TaxID=1766 RepID=UPI0007EB08E6|nr:DUF4259 domain-containing protein [Mycolicibacterium fortuitum]OBA98060.1 DUF4259 domain-containing protein [Mycolicibacterium fortuitum]OBI62487.1 DUF4259 domain-containing protein [Mycolicibacterium fortuitum]OBI62607.1 DUF4259 domain-containing protein [Mycolicibacterium fortuitum]